MQAKEIRPFIPSMNYEESVSFYRALGFSQDVITNELSIFSLDECTFFLYASKENEPASGAMYQLIVSNIHEAYAVICGIKDVSIKHEPIKSERWGNVFYLWGPSGELWHVTELGG